MLDLLDAALQQLLAKEAISGSALAKANFWCGVPDKAWRDSGSGLEVNIYLSQVHENAELRSNERRQIRGLDGTVSTELQARRLDCNYIITAWNKSSPIAGTENERQEHQVLAQILSVLWGNPTLPRKYLSSLLSKSQDVEIPVTLVDASSIGSTPDFWSGLGTYLRPAVGCCTTITVGPAAATIDPMVLGIATRLSGGDEFHTIAGTVYDNATPARPIPQAWVMIHGPTPTQIVISNDEGQYVIERLLPGSYTLSVRAMGFQDSSLSIKVPKTSGTYDAVLTPL